MGIFFNGGVAITPKVQAVAAPAGNSLLTSLISAWEFEEASGTRVDSHGSNDLTDNNTVGQGVGIQGNCADFENSNSEYLNIASNTDLQTGDIDFTFEVWVNGESFGGQDVVFCKWVSGSNLEYMLDYFSGAWRWIIRSGSTTYTANYGTVLTGSWQHIICYHDAGANEIGIIVDNDTPVTTAVAASGPNSANAQFTVGVRGDLASTYFDGLIDELRFWKRLLSTSEISDLYNSGAGRPYSYFE